LVHEEVDLPQHPTRRAQVKENSVNSLLVLSCGIAGGVIGGYAAIPAMMLWGDMDGLGVITWVPSGVAIGATVGVYIGTKLA
jgi:hypothetical protein